jgi:phosphate transport system substrate-binding protein
MLRIFMLILALSIACPGARAAFTVETRDWVEEAGVYIIRNGDLNYGLADAAGNTVLEPSLSLIGHYSHGLFRARDLNNMYGYIDSAGTVVIPFIYDAALNFSGGFAAVRQGEKMGYITPDGAWAWGRGAQYDSAGSFSQGYAPVEKGGRFGYIDQNGDAAWGKAHDFGEAYEFSCGLALVMKDRRYRYINTDGEFAFDGKFKRAGSFDCGIAYTYRPKKGSQFIDTSGNVLLTFDGELYEYDIHDENTIIVSGEFYTRTAGGFVRVPGVTSDFDHTQYYPNEGKNVPVLDEEPTLDSIPDRTQPLPRVDGATALLPMYAAFVQAVYPDYVRYENGWKNPDALFTCSRTPEAYRRLTAGETDIIFCAGPSEYQVEFAASYGVEFQLTPIGREAFVFIVNAKNPLENISLDDVRRIYSGEITSWDQLGVEGLGDIIAYQRPVNSGSQTTLEALMEGYPLMEAPEAYVAWDMGAILDRVEYRNYPNAIGYSFRFYVTGLTQADVKLLALDGVTPCIENITSGAYPQTTVLYAVTRKGDPNPNLKAFLEWVQSEQAAALIEKSGYVPW